MTYSPVRYKHEIATIRARLKKGELVCWRDIWALSDQMSASIAHKALQRMHADGEVHIAKYERGLSGRACPWYADGPGVDAKRPRKLSYTQKCRRWRAAHPDTVAAAQSRARSKRLLKNPPKPDPLLAALTGAKA